MNRSIIILLKVWLTLSAFGVLSTISAFPIFYTPELGDDFNLYVSKYNNVVVNHQFKRPFDIPLANQSIWPKNFSYDASALKIGDEVELLLIAAVPDDFDIEISSTMYDSAIQAELNGSSLRATVFIKSLNFEITEESDIVNLTALFDGFDFEQIRSKYSAQINTIFNNRDKLQHLLSDLPTETEGANGPTNLKLHRLFIQMAFAKIQLFILETDFVPAETNITKLAEFPNLMGVVYDFDPTTNLSLMNFPERPKFRMAQKFGFFRNKNETKPITRVQIIEDKIQSDKQIPEMSKNGSGARGKNQVEFSQSGHQEQSGNVFKQMNKSRNVVQVPLVRSEDEEVFVSSVSLEMNAETLPMLEKEILKKMHGVNLEKDFVYSHLLSRRNLLLI